VGHAIRRTRMQHTCMSENPGIPSISEVQYYWLERVASIG